MAGKVTLHLAADFIPVVLMSMCVNAENEMLQVEGVDVFRNFLHNTSRLDSYTDWSQH